MFNANNANCSYAVWAIELVAIILHTPSGRKASIITGNLVGYIYIYICSWGNPAGIADVDDDVHSVIIINWTLFLLTRFRVKIGCCKFNACTISATFWWLPRGKLTSLLALFRMLIYINKYEALDKFRFEEGKCNGKYL